MPAEYARGLLDTNIVVLRPWLPRDVLPAEVAISTITLAELSAGPHAVVGDDAEAAAERGRRMAVLQRVESEFDPLPFDVPAARMFGLITGVVVASGRSPRRRVADLQIAAIAAVNRLPLFTTNGADFAGLESVVTVVPIPRPSQAP